MVNDAHETVFLEQRRRRRRLALKKSKRHTLLKLRDVLLDVTESDPTILRSYTVNKSLNETFTISIVDSATGPSPTKHPPTVDILDENTNIVAQWDASSQVESETNFSSGEPSEDECLGNHHNHFQSRGKD